jgi:hypothetical protein
MKVTLRRVRVTIVPVESNKYYIILYYADLASRRNSG